MILSWMIFSQIDFMLALLNLQVRDVWSLSSLVWFPGGLLQGILFALAPRRWLLWVATSLLIHLTASQLYGRPVSVSLIFALFDALMMMMVALIWQFFYGAMKAPKDIRQIAMLIALCTISGIIERFITKWTLYLLDYPIDRTVSLLNIVGYVLSYLPLTFFVVYLITLKERWIINAKSAVLAAAGLAAVAILFSGVWPSDDSIHWQHVALFFSFCLPMLLALSGNLLILSGFLSLCAVGSVGVALCKLEPFVNPLASPQQNVLIAAWYSASLTLPALLCCSYSSALAARWQYWKMRFLLLKVAIGEVSLSQFHLDGGQWLDWQEGHRWCSSAQTPATWPQLLAWIHCGDRPAVEALKNAVSSSPQALRVHIADGKGGENLAILVLATCRSKPGAGIVGVINETVSDDNLEKN